MNEIPIGREADEDAKTTFFCSKTAFAAILMHAEHFGSVNLHFTTWWVHLGGQSRRIYALSQRADTFCTSI